jgi:hypothetical protein
VKLSAAFSHIATKRRFDRETISVDLYYTATAFFDLFSPSPLKLNFELPFEKACELVIKAFTALPDGSVDSTIAVSRFVAFQNRIRASKGDLTEEDVATARELSFGFKRIELNETKQYTDSILLQSPLVW